jgi:hypothetical protein
MQGHFRHLNFKKFPMVSWRLNLLFICLLNQSFEHLGLLDDCNSQSGSALGSDWVPSLALSPICESVFHIWTLSWPHGSLHSTLSHKFNVKVVIFLVSFLNVSPRGFPNCCTISLPFGLLAWICDFLFNLYGGFWETFRPGFFKMFLSFLNVLVNFSPHFFWRGWLHFLKGYCIDNLSLELSSYCPYHHIKKIVNFLSIHFGSNKGE